MNLYFRLIQVILSSFFKPRMVFNDTLSLPLRIFPNDLDINNHLNNGRYLTLLDLGSIALFLRSGILKTLLINRLRPIIGGVIITYRKGLRLFERCTLTMRMEAWDERWMYFRFEFNNSKGQLSAAGYFKGALVSKEGFYSNNEASKIFGITLNSCAMPPALTHWIASENAIID